MRPLIILVVSLVFQLSAGCQTDTTVIPFSAKWKVGDREHFNIIKVKQTWNSGRMVQNDSTQYKADFRIINKDDESYTILWKLKNPLLEASNLSKESYDKLIAKYDSTSVIYKTTRQGAFVEIINWKEISVMTTDIINEIIRKKTAETSRSSEEIRKSYLPVLSVYSTKRGIEQLVYKELLMFHFPFGNQYTIGKFYNYTEKLPVMQNTGPATGNGVIFIRKSNQKEKTCELVQRMKILPDSANNYLAQYFKSIGVLPSSIQKAVNESTLEINDNNIFQYKYEPGLPVHIIVERETKIDVLNDKINQIDRTIIERIND